jgi:hypothetical protein
MAGQRLGIAQINEPLDRIERIVELLDGFEAFLAELRGELLESHPPPPIP